MRRIFALCSTIALAAVAIFALLYTLPVVAAEQPGVNALPEPALSRLPSTWQPVPEGIEPAVVPVTEPARPQAGPSPFDLWRTPEETASLLAQDATQPGKNETHLAQIMAAEQRNREQAARHARLESTRLDDKLGGFSLPALLTGDDAIDPFSAPRAPSAAYTLTLGTVSRHLDSSALSSAFVLTNTAVISNYYDLWFYWPNGEGASAYFGYELGPGEAVSYDLATSPEGDYHFVGYIEVTSSELMEGRITTPDYGMIHGTVYENNGSTPLPNVWVDLRSLPDHEYFGGGNALSDGKYFIGGLPDGEYLPRAHASYPWASQWYGGVENWWDGTLVPVSGASQVGGIDFTLQPGGQITGTVYAADGVTPLPNLNVDLEQGNYGTCTDTNGHYVIQGVPYGDQVVVAGRDWNWCLNQPSQYAQEYYLETPFLSQATPLAVGAAQDTYTGIDFTLELGGNITGRVLRAADSSPVPDVRVNASEYDNGSFGFGATTDAQGYYTITGLIDADYRVSVDDPNQIPDDLAFQYYPLTSDWNQADRVTISGGNLVSDVDFALEPGGVITGVVIDQSSGQPIAYTNVGIDNVNENFGIGTCTDQDGVYTVRGAIYGEYKAWAGGDWNWCLQQDSPYVREYYPDQYNWQDGDSLWLDETNPMITGINFQLDIGGYIAGTVRNADAGGAPVEGLQMAAVQLGFPDCPWCAQWLDDNLTDANGDYLLGPLPPLEVSVYACTDCTGQLLVNEYYSDVYDIQDATLITPLPGETVTGIDLLLEEGVWITGTVTVPPGYSAENLPVSAWVTDGSNFNVGRRTDTDGNYIIPVPPMYDRRWGVQVFPEGTDLATQWAHQFDLDRATHWDFDLGPGATISGRITTDGAPLPGAWVNAHSSWGSNGSESDLDGYYTITNLPPGDYRVQADIWGSYYTSLYGGSDWGWARLVPLAEGAAYGGVDIDLQPYAVLEGHIYQQDGITPIEGLSVFALDAEGGIWSAGTQVDGSFYMELPAGEHKVYVRPEQYHNLVPAFYPGMSAYRDAQLVSVPPIASGPATISMNMVPLASLDGTVNDAGSGQPLGGIHVSALNVDPADGRQSASWTCTDESGYYQLEGLLPGETLVTALGTCGAYEYPAVTGTLNLPPGSNLTQNLSLNAATRPVPPFTVRSGESFDYSALLELSSYGNLENRAIVAALYAPLVQLDDQGDWYSELLTQVPTVNNGGAQVIGNQLVVTYTLKAGLLWSDGAPLTSADIRFAWELATLPHPNRDSYFSEVHPAWMVESVTTPDPLTAVFTYLPERTPPSYLTAVTYPLPEHVLAGEHPLDILWNSEYAHYPVGNGPYMVHEWVAGSHLSLVANPNYHKRALGYPLMSEVRFLFTDHPFYSLVSGNAHLSLNLPPEEIPADADTWDLQMFHYSANGFDAIIPNLALPFFAEQPVRQALYHALDREAFLPDGNPNGLIGHSWLPLDHPLGNPNVDTYAFDLATAAGMLDDAGWVDSNANGIRDKNGVEFSFDLVFPEDNWRQPMAAIFQDRLASIGVEANLVSMPWQELIQAGRRGELDAYTLGWIFDNWFDPQAYQILHSRSIASGYNSYETRSYHFWTDAINDSLLEAARTELDFTTLKSLYADQTLRFSQWVPNWIVMNHGRKDIALPTLLNFTPSPSNPPTWNMETWSVPANPYDLSVRKALATDSPPPQPGNQLIYELTVRNPGYFTMNNAVLVDNLPDNVSFVSAVPAPSSTSGDTLFWNLGDVPGGASLPPVRVVVAIPGAATHGTLIVNEARVSADQADTRPSNNGYLHQIEVREDVDLAVSKYGVGQPAVGERYSYFIDYANWGGAPASGAVVTDTLPPEVSLISADPPPSSSAGGVLTWSLPDLPGNQWGGQIELTAEINATGQVRNVADIDAGLAETTYTNNQDDHLTNVTSILAPVILKPTQGTTDGTPTISGLAPSDSLVEIYDLTALLRAVELRLPLAVEETLLATTTASPNGTFSVEANLAEGSYILAARATKSGLTSEFSNVSTIAVDHSLPLDPDHVHISASGVDISAGSVRAERYMLAYKVLQVSSQLTCATQPVANLRVTENGLLTYNIPPAAVTDLGADEWQLDFNAWLGEPHSTYEIRLNWNCGASNHSVLLIYILVDPDGYVYDQSAVDAGSDIEDALILNAVITAFVKVDSSWVVWPAHLYSQVNPQYSDGSVDDGVDEPGYYSFLTPSGQYRIAATAPGYQPFESDVLTVITTPVHLDIGLLPVSGGSGFSLAPADLSASGKTVDKDQAWVGEVLTYDLWLSNSGDEATSQLDLQDLIPAYTEYLSQSLSFDSGSGGYDPQDYAIWWQGVVDAGQVVHIQYQVQVTGSPGAPFLVASSSLVSGQAADVYALGDLTVTTLILNQVDASLSAPAGQAGDPGQALNYSFTLTNQGNFTETFNLSAANDLGWTVSLPSEVTLAAGASTNLPVQVSIPEATPADASAGTVITATSQTAPSVAVQASVSSSVNRVAALSLSPAPAQNAPPDVMVKYSHTLRNEGNAPDTFDLSAVSSQGWAVYTPDSLTLAAGEQVTFEVVVTVPASAAIGAVDTTTLTVTSQYDPSATTSQADVTTVIVTEYEIFMPVISKEG